MSANNNTDGFNSQPQYSSKSRYAAQFFGFFFVVSRSSRLKFLCIFALAVVFLGQGARAQQFVPNVAALRTCNSTTCCNNVACSTSNYIELGGYFASADGGQGIFQWYLGSAFCQNSFPSGKTTAGSNQIKNLSSTTGVQAGDAISDGSGAIPAGTYITAVSASALTMTISQNATTTNFGDTFTVGPDNGGTVSSAPAGVCFT